MSPVCYTQYANGRTLIHIFNKLVHIRGSGPLVYSQLLEFVETKETLSTVLR